jgi:HemY protein
MSLLVKIWLFLLAGAAAGIVLSRDSGYVLLSFGNYTVEMSLALLLMIFATLFVALYLGIRLIARTLHLPQEMREWQQKRGSQMAQQAMTRGLLEMSEGSWRSAERRLVRFADRSETPLLNYLAAARAAQLQGAHERRDSYIRLAHETMPSADVAVSLTQAEQQLGDWEHLRELMPELRRRKVEAEEELYQLEVRTHRALLEQAFLSGDAQRLELAWADVPRNLRQAPQLLGDYAGYLQEGGEDTKAERLLRAALDKRWDAGLGEIYGLLETDEPGRQLAQMEQFLSDRPDDPILLLTLGRLSLRAQLWGKARGYLEACIGRNGPPQAYRELGHLLESMHEPERAIDVYRRGLSGTGGPEPIPLPHDIGKTKANRPMLDDKAQQPSPSVVLTGDAEPSV